MFLSHFTHFQHHKKRKKEKPQCELAHNVNSHVTVTFRVESPKDKAGAINPAFDDLYPSEG